MSGPDGYTPTTDDIRDIIEWRHRFASDRLDLAAFNRWLKGLAEALVPPWDSDRACFGHCDKEGWHSECVSKAVDMIRCDYCNGDLPNVKDRAHVPTVPYLQRQGFDRDKIVCPECVFAGRVAAAMFNTPDPTDPEERTYSWPPSHPDDVAWWLTRAQAAINAVKES